MLVLWALKDKVPVDEFYCRFPFLFDCYFLVDLDGGKGTMGCRSCVGGAGVIVHVRRRSKVVFKVIIVRSHFGSRLLWSITDATFIKRDQPNPRPVKPLSR